MADEPLVPHRSYWLKIGAQTVSATIDTVEAIIDVEHAGDARAGDRSASTTSARSRSTSTARSRRVRYAQNRELGGFILIDKMSHATVAAGLIDGFPSNPVKAAERAVVGRFDQLGDGQQAHRLASTTAARLKSQGRSVTIVDDAAISGFPPSDPARVAREVARLLCRSRRAGAGHGRRRGEARQRQDHRFRQERRRRRRMGHLIASGAVQ